MEVVVFKVDCFFDSTLAERFEAFANGLTSPRVVGIEINSNGGQVQSLEKIANKIAEMKKQGFVFATSVEEKAYSCGFVLFLLGDIKVASPDAKFLMHPPTIEVKERINSNDAKEIYEVLEYAQMVSDKLVLENTNISEQAFNLLKKNETFMDRNDLIFLGLMENEYKF